MDQQHSFLVETFFDHLLTPAGATGAEFRGAFGQVLGIDRVTRGGLRAWRGGASMTGGGREAQWRRPQGQGLEEGAADSLRVSQLLRTRRACSLLRCGESE